MMKGSVGIVGLALALSSVSTDSYSISTRSDAVSEWELIEQAGYTSRTNAAAKLEEPPTLTFTLDEIAAFEAAPAPIAVGRPDAGKLRYGMKLEEDACIKPTRPDRSYGTLELITTLRSAACQMQRDYGIPLTVLDMSKEHGGKITWKDRKGRIRGHLSHQNGLDADVYQFVLEDGKVESAKGRVRSKDTQALEVNWNFVKALQNGPYRVEIFWSGHNINMLHGFVSEKYGDSEWALYGDPVLKNWKGHENHFHVRVLGTDTKKIYGNTTSPLRY